MNKIKPTMLYAEIFWMYWGVYCVISSFASVFLLEAGYTNTEIGLLLAAGNIASVVIQPFSANLADRSQKLNTLDILIIMTWIIAFFEIFTWLVGQKSSVFFISYLLVVAFHGCMQPLLNSVDAMFVRIGKRADYGISRSIGSLGFSLTSAGLGLLIAAAGARSLPLVSEGYLALMLIGLFFLRKQYKGFSHDAKKTAVAASGKKQEITMKAFAARHKLFLLITAGIFLIFYHHQIINYFMLQIFQNVGGESADIGIYYSLMSLLEIPALIGFSKLKKRFSTCFLLKLGTVGLVLRGILMYAASSPLGVQLSLVVNPIGFPLFLGAIVQYISEIMDEGEAVRGQSLYVVVITASAVVSSFTGGMILDRWGAERLLLICLLLCVLGAAVILPLIDKAAAECRY